MILHDWTVIVAKQTPAPQDKYPFGFKYERVDVDLRQLSNQELNKLYLEAQAITAQIQQFLSERG